MGIGALGDRWPSLVSHNLPTIEVNSTSRTSLLTGLPWDANSCWIDVAVEGLHTACLYGASLPDPNVSDVSVVIRLILQCAVLWSSPDWHQVLLRKKELWAQAAAWAWPSYLWVCPLFCRRIGIVREPAELFWLATFHDGVHLATFLRPPAAPRCSRIRPPDGHPPSGPLCVVRAVVRQTTAHRYQCDRYPEQYYRRPVVERW